jgi:hypothetical protein
MNRNSMENEKETNKATVANHRSYVHRDRNKHSKRGFMHENGEKV